MRIIIKIGTNVIAERDGRFIPGRIGQLVKDVAALRGRGHEVVMVSSGAVAAGRWVMPGLKTSVSKQVWAAVGQPVILEAYRNEFRHYDIAVGQCLALRNDFSIRDHYDNFVAALTGMLTEGIVPLINENDVMAISNITLGDNDHLAAMTAVALQADILILLTHKAGLFAGDPDKDPGSAIIPEVKNVDHELERLCSSSTSPLGRGGMLSKVRAAKLAVHAGIATHIADGRLPGVMIAVCDGDQVGTRFVPAPQTPSSPQQRWLLAAKGFGQITIDDGAVTALRSGKSLLLPGIVAIKGLFVAGEIVEVIGRSGEGVAYGKVVFDNQVLLDALAQRKAGAPAKLDREVIHRNYMAVVTK